MSKLPRHDTLTSAVTKLSRNVGPGVPLVFRYRATLVTPMLGGGVVPGEPDDAMPFRARSLRGQLRSWWRVLARGGVLGLWEHKPLQDLSPQEWRTWEADVWGGIADSAANLRASPVGIRVHLPARHLNVIEYSADRFDQLMPRARATPGRPEDCTWANYVYFSALPDRKANRGPRKVVAAGAAFDFDIVIKPNREDLVDVVKSVVEVWATLGGIGARTRRGAGAVSVTALDGGDAVLLCALGRPVLTNCKSLRVIAGDPLISSYAAFKAGTETMAGFRQKPPLGRDGNPRNPRSQGLSHWPEAHEIRKAARASVPAHRPERHGWAARGYPMPRAAFGLPMVIHFKDGPKGTKDVQGLDPADRVIVPWIDGQAGDRMASPVILRPVAQAAQRPASGAMQFAPCLVLLNAAVLGDRPLVEVALTQGTEVSSQRWPVWDSGWNAPNADTGVAPLDRYRRPSQGKGGFKWATSVPSAFANYFIGCTRRKAP